MINLNILNFLALFVALTPSLFASSAGAAEGFGYDEAGRAHTPLSMTRAEQTAISTVHEPESPSTHNTTVEMPSKFLSVLRALVKYDEGIEDSDKMDARTILVHLKESGSINFYPWSLPWISLREVSDTILYVLPQLTNLRELNLSSDNQINPDGAKALVPVLGGLRELEILHLGSNKLGPDGAEDLWSALARLTKLRELDLSNNRLGSDGTKALVPALAKLKTLHVFKFSINGIGPDGAMALVPALAQLTNLQDLYLSDNGLGADGVKALEPALDRLTGLRALYLSDNGLGAGGAMALVPALMRLTTLRELDLSYNEIGPIAGRIIASILPPMDSLEHLNLNDNSLGSDLVFGPHFNSVSHEVDPKDFCLVNITNAHPRILSVSMFKGNNFGEEDEALYKGKYYPGKEILDKVLKLSKKVR